MQFDVARCATQSDAVIAAMAEHLHAEQRMGGYQAVETAASRLDGARARLAKMVGNENATVEFVDNGTAAVRHLFESWPLPANARIALSRSEFASNRMVLERLAQRDGLTLHELPERADGRLELENAEEVFRNEIDLVVISHVSSQRGLVQPVDSLIEIARREGAAVLVDVCQSLGHVPVPVGADAYAGTSRKWLHGPRGVGFVVVTTELGDSLDGPPTLQTHRTRDGSVEPLAGAPTLEASEAAVAARLGLAQALEDLHDIGLGTVRDRLRELGRELRESLAGLSDWRAREPVDEPTALVTLQARGSISAEEVVIRLRGAEIAAGVVPAGRALNHQENVLRLSPDPGATTADIARIREVLVSIAT